MLELYTQAKFRGITSTVASTGAGDFSCTLRPTFPDRIWVVVHAFAIQTAGKALTVSWIWVDADGTTTLSSPSINSDTALPWDGRAVSVKGLANGMPRVSYDSYLRATLTADGNGQNLYIRAVVAELKGPYYVDQT